MATDFPDWVRGVYQLARGLVISPAQDFPDWTDGVTVVDQTITAGMDFPDWTKAVQGVSGVGYVTPPTPAGLVCWYDASQLTVPADGSKLAAWTDESGNGHDLTNSNTSSQPTFYRSTSAQLVNGHPAVRFTAAASTYLDVLNVPTGTNPTLCAVFRNNAPTAHSFLWDTAASSPPRLEISANTYNASGDGGTTVIHGGTTDTAAHSLIVLYGGTGQIWLDGTEVASGNTNNSTTPVNTMALGVQSVTLFGFFYDGWICELFVYNQNLSAADVTGVHNYLKAKWGTG